MNFHKSQTGITIIEVLIVLTITSIIGTFTIMRVSDAKDDFQRQNIARELKVSIERARFDSIKRSPFLASDESRIVIHNDTSFSLISDTDQNGKLDAADTRRVDFARLEKIKIQEDGFVYPITLSFDRRGFMTATNGIGTVIEPLFIVCNDCGASSDNFSVLTVSPTGTVRMTEGAQSLPSFPIPQISAVQNNSQIDELAMIE